MEMENILNLLKKPPSFRTQEEINLILLATQSCKFFQEQGPKIHLKCCWVIKYESAKKGQQVIVQGELGDKYYIMLKGEVKVLLRTNNQQIEVSRLFPGSAFGELALINNQPRAATIECTKDSEFAVIEKEHFNRILGKLESERINEHIEFFKSLPLFSKWTRKAIEKVTFYFEEKKLKKRDLVFKEGEEAKEVYIVKEGEFLMMNKIRMERSFFPVVRKGNLERDFSSKVTAKVAIKSKGEVFGDEEIAEGVKRTRTCVCQSDTAELYVISKEDFLTKIQNAESLEFLNIKRNVKNFMLSKTNRGHKLILSGSFGQNFRERVGHESKYKFGRDKMALSKLKGEVNRKILSYSTSPVYHEKEVVRKYSRHEVRRLVSNIKTGLDRPCSFQRASIPQ